MTRSIETDTSAAVLPEDIASPVYSLVDSPSPPFDENV